MKKRLLVFLAASAVVLGLFAAVYPAAASMLILPVRVYFKDGERMRGLTVLNTGNDNAVFRVAFEHKKQKVDGGYESLTEPLVPGYDPSSWLVFSPRQVSLEPQAKQAIRLSLRRPADMPDGEYRVHMALDRSGQSAQSSTGGASAKTAKMMINVGFAIPVIIRKGKNDTVAEIKNYSVLPPDSEDKSQRHRVMVEIARTGKFSTVGEISVFWTPPGSDEIRIGQQRGVIIYPELAGRNVRVFIDRVPQGGKLRIVYNGMEIDRGVVFDERTYSL